MNRTEIIHALKKEREALGKTRDRLRDILSDVQEEYDAASEAWDSLDTCIDKLSELH